MEITNSSSSLPHIDALAKQRPESSFFQTVRAVFVEIGWMFFSGLLLPFGWARSFRWFGMNPTVLTEEQKKYPPILLLHGSHANEGIFLFLGRFLAKHTFCPIFSCHYDESNIVAVIAKKCQEIALLYGEGEKIKPILIGHSLGAIGGGYLAYCQEIGVDRMISIAGRLAPCGKERAYADVKELVQKVGDAIVSHKPKNLYTITALQDWLVDYTGTHQGDHAVDLGGVSHLSVLFDSRTQQQILHWLPATCLRQKARQISTMAWLRFFLFTAR